MSERLLVIDADPLIYRFAASSTVATVDGNTITVDEDPSAAEGKLVEEINRIVEFASERFDINGVVLALTCGPTFRKRINPEYKANRDPSTIPPLFNPLRDYAMRQYACMRYPGLEGDDIIGILATSPGGAVFASTDKDMAGVPGTFLHLRRDDSIDVRTISREAADRFHLEQTLIGDKTDGYAGCPGIGEKKAPAIADGGWLSALEAFRSKGLGRDAFLLNARMARILRHDDFDPEEGFNLWSEQGPGMPMPIWLPHEEDTRGILGSREADFFLREAGYMGDIADRMLDDAQSEAVGEDDRGGYLTNAEVEAADGREVGPFKSAPQVQAPDSPFEDASVALAGRMKLLVWGESGVGKTPLALAFPSPAIVDFEAGAEAYRGLLPFGLLRATTVAQLYEAIDFLADWRKHAYRTVAVDSLSVMWEVLQRQWSDTFLRRNVGGKGFRGEFYQVQPLDWAHIKGEYRSIIRRLMALGMNLVCTARSKDQFAQGEMMKVTGETFDAEKGTNYLFDTVIKLRRFDPETGAMEGECMRDRWRRLASGPFACHFDEFRAIVGGIAIDRRAEPVAMASEEQRARVTHLAREHGMTDEFLLSRLQANGANSLEELTAEKAAIIISRMEHNLASKRA